VVPRRRPPLQPLPICFGAPLLHPGWTSRYSSPPTRRSSSPSHRTDATVPSTSDRCHPNLPSPIRSNLNQDKPQ
jgi:hypothetical protein